MLSIMKALAVPMASLAAGHQSIGCTWGRLSPRGHQQIVRGVTREKGGKEVAFGVGGGDNADCIGDHKRCQSLLDSSDFREGNEEL